MGISPGQSPIAMSPFCLRRVKTVPSQCDAMMHVLKDSTNLKYSELLTKVIGKCNLI